MVNKVLLVGRLCTDPELKYTPSGVAVANFRVAVDRPYKNGQGEKETDFIDVVAWRKTAEFVNTYMTKGRLIFVEGALQVRQWQTQDGQRRRSTEVVADNVKALDRGNGGQQNNQQQDEGFNPDFDVPDITDPFADQ